MGLQSAFFSLVTLTFDPNITRLTYQFGTIRFSLSGDI